MRHAIRNLLFALFCTLFLILPVSAAEVGSLLLTHVKKDVELFLVADETGSPVAAFSEVRQTLDEVSLSPETAKLFFDVAKKQSLCGTVQSKNEEGEIFFPDLKQGWYLVCGAEESAEFTPFLVRVPMTLEEREIYHIKAQPKVDGPTKPIPSTPLDPEANIPQTGAILWPKVLLLSLGGLSILAGLFFVVTGQKKTDE
ncbi:MAG: hypothetical protein J6J21_01110 [Clostridia bacterium]|nr:hypothetical protein [Clostridia bacterium]